MNNPDVTDKPETPAASTPASGWDALPEHIKAHERERTLRYIIREILATPHNPRRWEQWAKTELQKLGPLREAHPNSD